MNNRDTNNSPKCFCAQVLQQFLFQSEEPLFSSHIDSVRAISQAVPLINRWRKTKQKTVYLIRTHMMLVNKTQLLSGQFQKYNKNRFVFEALHPWGIATETADRQLELR